MTCERRDPPMANGSVEGRTDTTVPTQTVIRSSRRSSVNLNPSTTQTISVASPSNYFAMSSLSVLLRVVTTFDPESVLPEFGSHLCISVVNNNQAGSLHVGEFQVCTSHSMAKIRCPNDSDAVVKALRHIARTSTICLESDGNDVNEILPDLLQPAPLLAALSPFIP
ncbi:hypothetical protein L218DRAFT_1079162 [Marasmius fiardii PR-910]|nr:hypothetical protein L218DRAFT_1079162 [Marasmius fiardii PR-910]